MKQILRTYLFHLLALWICTQILGNSFTINGGINNYLLAAGVLAILNVLLKPILKLLFLPINALTLGLFALVINVMVFYIFLHLIPQVNLSPWTFPGISANGLSIQSFQLNYLGTLFILSLIISVITNILTILI